MIPRLLDTCIVIDFLRRKPDAKAFIRNLDQIPFLSAITVAELYAGVREGEERRKLDKLVNAFHTVPVTEDIGRRGGLHRRQYFGFFAHPPKWFIPSGSVALILFERGSAILAEL
jgi:predicted nucleic acid-binding protein